MPDRSYYDSVVVIAQFFLFNNFSLYEQAFNLLSPARRHPQSLEEYSNGYSYNIKEIENIKEIKIASIRPFFEGTLQIQSVTTPDPSTRRKFIVMIDYVKRENATAGENNVQSRFITTILEKGEWKIYSINTSP